MGWLLKTCRAYGCRRDVGCVGWVSKSCSGCMFEGYL